MLPGTAAAFALRWPPSFHNDKRHCNQRDGDYRDSGCFAQPELVGNLPGNPGRFCATAVEYPAGRVGNPRWNFSKGFLSSQRAAVGV